MLTMEQSEELKTVGEIADELNQPFHRVAYIIRSRRMGEVKRMGITRLFGPKTIEKVKAELQYFRPMPQGERP